MATSFFVACHAGDREAASSGTQGPTGTSRGSTMAAAASYEASGQVWTGALEGGGTVGTGANVDSASDPTDSSSSTGDEPPWTCGDGLLEAAEACDGVLFPAGKTCATVVPNRPFGRLTCTKCRISDERCSFCGDDVRTGDELCDGMDAGPYRCETLPGRRFVGGNLACTSDCQWDVSGCVLELCGNDRREGNELCDGADLGGGTCKLEAGEDRAAGQLGCDDACRAFNTADCRAPICGNAEAEPGEDCDTDDLANHTCLSLGYLGGGNLGCRSSDCAFEVAGCLGPKCSVSGEACVGADDCCAIGAELDCVDGRCADV